MDRTAPARRSFFQAVAIVAVVAGFATIPSTGGVLAWPLFLLAAGLAGAVSLRSPGWRVACAAVAGLALAVFALLGLVFATIASSGF
ncbi:MAG TPA: hypothetical protein VF519_11170 [Mycobacteriales bacterium]|jgi:hypothetical protein